MVGSKAMAPIASDGRKSLRGVHEVPVVVLSQIPPPAAPSSKCAALPGSTAMQATRPITSTRFDPYVCPLGILSGPRNCHVDGAAIGAADGPARAARAALGDRGVP